LSREIEFTFAVGALGRLKSVIGSKRVHAGMRGNLVSYKPDASATKPCAPSHTIIGVERGGTPGATSVGKETCCGATYRELRIQFAKLGAGSVGQMTCKVIDAANIPPRTPPNIPTITSTNECSPVMVTFRGSREIADVITSMDAVP